MEDGMRASVLADHLRLCDDSQKPIIALWSTPLDAAVDNP